MTEMRNGRGRPIRFQVRFVDWPAIERECLDSRRESFEHLLCFSLVLSFDLDGR